MWCSKKVTKSSTCTATCWDGAYRQTGKPWPCSEVKLLLIMNLSESLPMEFDKNCGNIGDTCGIK